MPPNSRMFFPHFQVFVQRTALAHVADVAFDLLALAHDVEARRPYRRPLGRAAQAAQHPHCGRFAGAVRAEESKISPRPTSKLMWSTAVKLPNRLVSPFVSITLSFIGTVQFHVTIFDTRFDRLDPQIAVSFRGQVSGQLLFGQRRVGRRVVRVAERRRPR